MDTSTRIRHPYADNYYAASVDEYTGATCLDIDHLSRRFFEDGYVVVPNLLSAADAAILRTEIERKYLHPATQADGLADQIRRDFALMRMFEFAYSFLQVLASRPLLTLVERILGANCHVISQTALRTPRGKGITRWHIDGDLYFDARFIPQGEDILPMPPCFSLGAMIALSDFSDVAYGPTRMIPRSHRFGFMPRGDDDDMVRGHQHETFFAEPGDALIINHQTWHSAHQNQSERLRYLLVTSYGQRFIQQRFFPFINYMLPEHVNASLGDVTRRLLGGHEKGPLG